MIIEGHAGLTLRAFLSAVGSGTYQDSEYGWRCFDDGRRPMNPTVALWPDRRRSKIPCASGMQVFSDSRDAVEFPRLA